MNIPCFLKSIDDTEYNIWFASIEAMEAFIIRENAKQQQSTSRDLETGEAKSSSGMKHDGGG